MFFTILALADEGDEVLYPDPGFPDVRVDHLVRRGGAGAACRCASATASRIDTDELPSG